MYTAILFDMDGVLLRPPDRSAPMRGIIKSSFRTFDIEPTTDDIQVFYGGPGDIVERVNGVCRQYNLDLEKLWAELEQQTTDLQRQMIEQGERDLYEDHTVLSDLTADHDLGIVSNNTQGTIEFMVEYFGLSDDFGPVYGREPTVVGYQRRKPDPYYVEQALSDLGTRSVLFVGDSLDDILVAQRTGLDSAFVRRDTQRDSKISEDPTYDINRLTELLELVTS